MSVGGNQVYIYVQLHVRCMVTHIYVVLDTFCVSCMHWCTGSDFVHWELIVDLQSK